MQECALTSSAGVKPGIEFGRTDDFCYNITRDPVRVRDFHATYRYQGLDMRLTGVEKADVVKAVDEVSLQPVSDDPSQLRIRVAVGDRRYHAQRLQELTGLDVGEGQARILLGDLRAYQAQLPRGHRRPPPPLPFVCPAPLRS